MTNEEYERLGREVVGKALRELGVRVHMAAGRAMASTLRNKPESEVTDAEAWSVLENFVVAGDEQRTWSIARAGSLGMLQALGGLVPPVLADLLAGTFRASEESEVRGLAIPRPQPSRGSGKPVRYGPPSKRADVGRWLVREIGFQTGYLRLSLDASVGLVTGVTRSGKQSPHGPALLPLGGSWRAARLFADRAKADSPELWTAAVAAGDLIAQKRGADPAIMSAREEVLAIEYAVRNVLFATDCHSYGCDTALSVSAICPVP
jgi:hypothetical protein